MLVAAAGIAVAVAVATAAATAPASAPTGRPSGPPSDRGRLTKRTSFGGDISPKSVAASGTGLVFAQNMMYRHSVTVYDARRLRLRATIPDTVRLSRLGYPQFPGTQRGAPVEAAFSPGGRYAYVSNYSMYGPGFGPEGSDVCSPASGYDRSFVYRIRLDRAEDRRRVPGRGGAEGRRRHAGRALRARQQLVLLRPQRDLDAPQGGEVRRIPIGAYPRGIVVSPTRPPPTSPSWAGRT